MDQFKDWRIGNHDGCVVSSERPPRNYTEQDYENEKQHYGGYLVCESIARKEDAKLIAAAPDLLEALQELFFVCSSPVDMELEYIDAMAKAQLAIKKSTE